MSLLREPYPDVLQDDLHQPAHLIRTRACHEKAQDGDLRGEAAPGGRELVQLLVDFPDLEPAARLGAAGALVQTAVPGLLEQLLRSRRGEEEGSGTVALAPTAQAHPLQAVKEGWPELCTDSACCALPTTQAPPAPTRLLQDVGEAAGDSLVGAPVFDDVPRLWACLGVDAADREKGLCKGGLLQPIGEAVGVPLQVCGDPERWAVGS